MMKQDTNYVAVTGMQHYYGSGFLRPGQLVHLKNEPDNPHDQEAIIATVTPIGKIGYVANSPQTVTQGCKSAGRIYDMFEMKVSGLVRFVTKDTAIVEIVPDLHEMHMTYIGNGFNVEAFIKIIFVEK